MKNKNESHTGKIPKLRFPEFQDAPEWEEKRLSSISRRIVEKVGNAKLPTVSITAGAGFVTQAEKFGRDISGEQYKNYILLDKGEFAYNKGNSKRYPQGCIYKLKEFEKVAAPNAFICFRLNSGYVSDFFQNYFEFNHHGEQLKKFITSGARSDGLLNINSDDFFTITFPTPEKAEQQKIADCLLSLGELIAAQTQKLNSLRIIKKGMMQQLFPIEGETIPQLRFPEFRCSDGWKKMALGNFIEEYRENSTIQDEFEVLTSARDGLIRQKDYYDNNRITERDNMGFNIIPPNYLTYRSRSDDRRFFFNENNLGITGIISTYYPVFRIINGSNKFFIELLSFYSNIVGKHSVGTSQTVLSMNELKRIKLPLPICTEQQKIADCLSSLDELITMQAQTVDALKAHKKGLMQQLFPSADGVNG